MGRKSFASVQLSVMCRLLCSLLVSLVTDGAVPYPSGTCQHYSQLLENRLLNHQLEQCINSQSYRLITYCLHNHMMYIQGPWCQKCFPVMSPHPLLLPFPHQRIQTPGSILRPWHYHHAPLPPSTPNATQMLQPSKGICQINGETY